MAQLAESGGSDAMPPHGSGPSHTRERISTSNNSSVGDMRGLQVLEEDSSDASGIGREADDALSDSGGYESVADDDDEGHFQGDIVLHDASQLGIQASLALPSKACGRSSSLAIIDAVRLLVGSFATIASELLKHTLRPNRMNEFSDTDTGKACSQIFDCRLSVENKQIRGSSWASYASAAGMSDPATSGKSIYKDRVS